MTDPWVYVVTDIETDGPWPGPNSMRSLASVAVTAAGEQVGEFEAVLAPLPGAAPSPKTLAWFESQPEAWAAATTGPRPVPEVLGDYVDWVSGLPGPRMLAAAPLGFDGTWVDYYLRRFTGYGVAQGPYETDRIFDHAGLCIRSYAAAVTGRPFAEVHTHTLPAAWLGDVPHTHRALDDARGYAHLLTELLRRSGSHPGQP